MERQRGRRGIWPALIASLVLGLAVASLTTTRPRIALASSITSATDFPTPGGDPWGTTFDGNGRVWVAMPGCDPSPSCSSSTPPGKIGLFDPASQSWTTVVSLPSGYGQPLFVALDKVGKVWFTMPPTNSIGVYDPASASVSQWSVPTASAGPWDLAIDANGTVWFTEHFTNKIGSFNPATQTFNEVATPATNSDPYGITVDSSNNVWFTENTDAVAMIAKYSQGVLSEYKIRTGSTSGSGLTPHLITIAANGNPWWSEGWVHSIGTLNLSLAQPGTNAGVTEYQYTPACGNCGSHTSGIATDSLGQVWLDDSLQNSFGSFPEGGGSFTFYNSPSGGHPHDGLNVDSQNRIWFNEEFANRLAEAIQGNVPPTTTTTAPTTTTTGPTTTTTTAPPGAWTQTAADTFQRPNQSLWGVASDGLTWGGDANLRSAFSIAGGAGDVAGTGSSTYSAVLGPTATDAEAFATASISSFAGAANFGDVVRWKDGNNWYKAYIDGGHFIIQRKVNGAATTLASSPFAAASTTPYTIHFRVVGNNLSANVWPASGTEPTGWMLSVSDSSLSSGMSGMRLLTRSGTATVTSFSAGIPGPPGGTTTTTAPTTTTTGATTTTTGATTSTTGATTTTVPTTTTTAPTSGNVVAMDTFQRAGQSEWGTASDGQAWGGDANTLTQFSISGNAGLVSNTGGSSYSAVLGPAETNAEVYATGSISAFTNTNFGDVLRWTDGNNWYKAYIDGGSLIIQKKVAGAATTLANVPFAATAGTSYTVHFRAVGSTLTANVWTANTTEPTGWMATATDTTLTSGFCGMRFLTQGGTATVTSFEAKTV